ncbi:hypothetical protein [Maribacter luteus]|uniref:hypothetical protein n=1 Tax=Maribacter luteus TaxID=2594478 RepID=UPI0024906140|nr:hypothetical protein [Maribacter luteus]
MKQIIEALGKFFYRFLKRKEHFYHSMEKSEGKKTLFLLFLMTPIAMIAALTFSDSFKTRLLIFIGYLIISFLTIVLSAGYHSGLKRFQRDKHGLEMIKINLYGKEYPKLLLTDEDLDNFHLLLMGYIPQTKINNRNLIKNGSSANYFFVFSLMHRFVIGGIVDIDTTRRKILFGLIRTSFSMNGSPVNPNTLESSFSRWNTSMKDKQTMVLEHEKIVEVFGEQ